MPAISKLTQTLSSNIVTTPEWFDSILDWFWKTIEKPVSFLANIWHVIRNIPSVIGQFTKRILHRTAEIVEYVLSALLRLLLLFVTVVVAFLVLRFIVAPGICWTAKVLSTWYKLKTEHEREQRRLLDNARLFGYGTFHGHHADGIDRSFSDSQHHQQQQRSSDQRQQRPQFASNMRGKFGAPPGQQHDDNRSSDSRRTGPTQYSWRRGDSSQKCHQACNEPRNNPEEHQHWEGRRGIEEQIRRLNEQSKKRQEDHERQQKLRCAVKMNSWKDALEEAAKTRGKGLLSLPEPPFRCEQCRRAQRHSHCQTRQHFDALGNDREAFMKHLMALVHTDQYEAYAKEEVKQSAKEYFQIIEHFRNK